MSPAAADSRRSTPVSSRYTARSKIAASRCSAFPCNQFGGQEPGTDAEIQQFCAEQYHVTFPVFAKIDVNGANAHPLYVFLKSRQRGLLGSRCDSLELHEVPGGPAR